jgi:hypothetical protein
LDPNHQFTNMNMSDGPGRSYKYLKDPSLALWPFGFGLSYTTFAMSPAGTDYSAGAASSTGTEAVELHHSQDVQDELATVQSSIDPLLPRGSEAGRAQAQKQADAQAKVGTTEVKIKVTNTGKMAGDEVVFMYHNASAAIEVHIH